jgi:hypothetical protein
MKTHKYFPVQRCIEAEAVEDSNWPDFLVVYAKWTDQKDIMRVIMHRRDFQKIRNPKDFSAFKQAKVELPHRVAQRGRSFHQKAYESGRIDAYSPEQIEAYIGHDIHFKGPTWKVKWGEAIPGGWILAAHGVDFEICYASDGAVIQRPHRDFYLYANWNIQQIVDDFKSGKQADLVPIPRYKHRPDEVIHFIPGNGHTLDLDVHIKPDQYQHFIALDHYNKKEFLKENTSLGKYFKPTVYHDSTDEEDEY